MRDNWTTATAGHREGYSIAGRVFVAIFAICGALFLIWAASNQTIIN